MKFFESKLKNLSENKENIKTTFLLDEVDDIISNIDKYIKQNTILPKDILNSLKLKKELNPNIWHNNKINPIVKSKLIHIAKDFIEYLNLNEKLNIIDVIFTGSLANFNWSKFSDIDLHIVIDFSKLEMNEDLAEEFFKTKKETWMNEHDISLLDYPVEVYIQNSKVKLNAKAIYSLIKNKWILKPRRESFSIDINNLKLKCLYFLKELKNLQKDYQNKDYQKVIFKIKKIKNKLKNLRKSGLESGGEYSLENLVFKVLRRTNFMDILDNLKAKSYDTFMSLSENIDTSNDWISGGVLFIKGQHLENNEQRLYATHIKNILFLDRIKKDNTNAERAKMAVFGNNEVYRISLNDSKLKAIKVAWNSENTMLEKLGLSKTSLVLNSKTKTPLHWESLKINNIPECLSKLSDKLKSIPNIKWTN